MFGLNLGRNYSDFLTKSSLTLYREKYRMLRRNIGVMLVGLTMLSSCATQTTVARKDNIGRLLNHVEFEAVKKYAPNWGRDALHTINDLETQLKRNEILLRESVKNAN